MHDAGRGNSPDDGQHRGLSNVHFWNGRCTCNCRRCIGMGGQCICPGCEEHGSGAPQRGTS